MKLLNSTNKPKVFPYTDSVSRGVDKSLYHAVVKRKSDDMNNNDERPNKKRILCTPPVVRKFPCKARGMPEDHNVNTAFLEVGPNTPHGMILGCSSPSCNQSGRKFRFCSVCNMPVAKRNFFRRHGHGLFKSSKEIRDKVDKVYGFGYPTETSQEVLQPVAPPSVDYCQPVSVPSVEPVPLSTPLPNSWDLTPTPVTCQSSPNIVSPDIRGLAGVTEEIEALEPITIDSINSVLLPSEEERTLEQPVGLMPDPLAPLIDSTNQAKRTSLTYEELDRALDCIDFDTIFDEVPVPPVLQQSYV